jgi:Mg-chelatase subunit ChlD
MGAAIWCSGSGCSSESKTSGTGQTSTGGASAGPVLITTDASTRSVGDCVAQVAAAEGLPLDLYVMFDQSGSMITPSGSGTRLDAVRAALTDFARQNESSGIGVGIGYFGYLPLGQTSCDPSRYRDPAVAIDELPGNADPLIRSLQALKPVGETPTAAAIRGACDYATEWKASHPDRVTVMLLMTDGVPEAPVTSQQPGGCNPTLEDAVAATTTCNAAGAGLRTYVIGVGPSLSNLDRIAAAGGTEKAYLVEGGDVAAQVLAALNAVRGAAQIPCELKIPPSPEGEVLDYERLNIDFVDGQGTTHDVLAVPSADDCGDGDGWHYDDPSNPSTVQLCNKTCALVEGDVKGRLEFALGCTTLGQLR